MVGVSSTPCARRRCQVVVLVALLVAARYGAGESFPGRVVSVRDGDTLEVMRGGKAVRVRLWGVDCPELAQAFGPRAKQRTSDLAFGREVRVTVVDRDRYGRLVVQVEVDGRDLGEALLQAGMAWWYRHHAPEQRSYERAEREARAARRGLWADGNPVAPWSYRQVHSR